MYLLGVVGFGVGLLLERFDVDLPGCLLIAGLIFFACMVFVAGWRRAYGVFLYTCSGHLLLMFAC